MPEIKIIPKKDLHQYAEIASGAFPGMGMNTKEKIKELTKWLIKRQESKGASFYGLYKNKQLAGGILLHDFQMNLFGQKVLCGGGGFLVVDLMHKKEHVARDLCKYFFQHYRKLDAPFASLYPFRPDFYRMMGAGYGTKTSVYRVHPKDLPSHGSKKLIRKLTIKDRAKITTCFNKYADRKTGMFYDYKEYRENFFKHNKESKFFGYEKDGKLLGYLVFKFIKKNTNSVDDFLHNEIHITEMVYLNNDVLSSLFALLHSQKDQVDVVHFISHDENFHFAFADPRNDTGNMYSPVYHETNNAAVGVMFRLLNPKLLFQTLKSHSFTDVTIRVKLDIKDTFLKANNKPTVVWFENGLPTLKSANSKTDVTLTIDTADFSSMLLGAVDLKSLHDYRLAKLSNEKYLDTLHKLFSRDEKPICLHQF